MTAAFLLLREPGAGCRMNGGFRGRSIERRQRSHLAISHVRPTQRAGGEGPESHLGLLAFTALLRKRLYLRISRAQMEAQERPDERERRGTHPTPASAVPVIIFD